MVARKEANLSKARSPQLDWQVCQSDTEWEAASQALPASPRPRRPGAHRLTGLVVLLYLVLGGWLLRTAQAGLTTVETELTHTVDAELWTEREGAAPPAAGLTTPALPLAHADATYFQQQRVHQMQTLATQAQDEAQGQWSSVNVAILDLEGDVAVVQMVLQPVAGGPAHRQTRVYRRTEAGWLRTAPSAAAWGPAHRLETSYFVFHYHDQDEWAVKAAALELDAAYPSLYAAFFTGAPTGEKLVVQVDPAQPPGKLAERTTKQDPLVAASPWLLGQRTAPESRTTQRDSFVVASPAAYLAPVDISPADLLAQSVVLVLLDDLSAETLAGKAPAVPALLDDAGTSLRLNDTDTGQAIDHAQRLLLSQLLVGVRLWQLWQSDLPLADWRDPVVQWVYSDLYDTQGSLDVAPDFMHEFCAMHRLWVYAPSLVQIPLNCDDQDRHMPELAWRLFDQPPTQLAQLAVPLSVMGEEVAWTHHPAAAVALATVMEYAAAAYGPERIPLLVAIINQHERVETLIPAVFGVSAGEFEAGWQSYLAEHYHIAAPPRARADDDN
jgi:hypothetical protein